MSVLKDIRRLLLSERQATPLNAASVSHTVGATAQTLAVASVPVPTVATGATGYVRSASIVMYRDGTVPTSTSGEQWNDGDIIHLLSRDEIRLASFIRQGGVSATITWTFYALPE